MQNPTDPDADPKSGGLGAEALSSFDAVTETHKAVRELLLALEGLPVTGNGSDLFDALRNKAQVARRRLEDVDADLQSLKNTVTVRPEATSVSGASGMPEVHVHLHLTLSSNGR